MGLLVCKPIWLKLLPCLNSPSTAFPFPCVQTSIKTNDLLNCVRLTLNPQAPVLVSDSYYAEKDQLIITEQVVCRCIKFDFSGLDPPHKYLYCFCKTLVVPVNVVRLATCALNDSLSLPDDQRALDGATAAAAALYVAAEVLKERLSLCRVSSERDGRGNEKHRHTHYSTEHKEKERVDEESAVGTWWEGLGIDKEELKKAVECLTHLLVQSPQ